MSNDKRGFTADDGLKYVQYDVNKEEVYLDPIRQLIAKDLSGWWHFGQAEIEYSTYFSRTLQYICLSIFLIPMGSSLLHGMASLISKVVLLKFS